VLWGTILANGPGGNCGGAVTSRGFNLDTDGTCHLAGSGDIIGSDPKLGPLGDNGGPTYTHKLLDGSAAIDSSDPGAHSRMVTHSYT